MMAFIMDHCIHLATQFLQTFALSYQIPILLWESTQRKRQASEESYNPIAKMQCLLEYDFFRQENRKAKK